MPFMRNESLSTAAPKTGSMDGSSTDIFKKQAHEAVVSEADALGGYAVDLGDNHMNQAALPRRHGLEVARAAGLQDLLRQAVRILANAVVTSLSVSVNVDDQSIPRESGVRSSRYGNVLKGFQHLPIAADDARLVGPVQRSGERAGVLVQLEFLNLQIQPG